MVGRIKIYIFHLLDGIDGKILESEVKGKQNLSELGKLFR